MLEDMKDGDVVQIAHVVRDLDKVLERYTRDFGFGPWDLYTYGPHNVQDMMYKGKPANCTYRLALCMAGKIQIELMQPVSGEGVYTDFLKERGEGIHHVKIYYKDCRKALADYAKKGYTVIQSGRIHEDVFYYLDSMDKMGGALIEIGNAGSIPPPDSRYPA